MIVALGLIDLAQAKVRQRLQDDILAGRGGCEGTLGGSDSLITHHCRGNEWRESQRPVPADADCRGLADSASRRYARMRLVARRSRAPVGKPEIDGLLACVARLRQMREGTERMLEVPHGLAVGRGLSPLPPEYVRALSHTSARGA